MSGDQVAQEVHEVLGLGRVGDPAGDPPVVDVESGKEHGGPVAFVLELSSSGLARDGRLGRVDPGLGLHPRLFIDAPHHGIGRRIEVETADVGRLGPKFGVVRGHPGLDLPGFEVQGLADPPGLRGRDRHAVVRHGLGQRLHRPARRPLGGVLGHQFHQEQDVIVVIDVGTAGALFVLEAGHTERFVTPAPDPYLVVVHAHGLADGAIDQPSAAKSTRRARWATRASTVLERTVASRWARSPRLNFKGASRMTTAKHIM